MYLMLQFAHTFIISGMHNERNMTFECTTFIVYSTNTTGKPHLKQNTWNSAKETTYSLLHGLQLKLLSLFYSRMQYDLSSGA
jgi:hypothetical protein